VNSRWSRRGRRAASGAAYALLLLAAGCGRGGPPAALKRNAPADPAQADAEALGNQVADLVDQVMSYKSSHRGKLPTSFRQAGIDTLTHQFIFRLGHQGNEPVVTVLFRHPEEHQVSDCSGTNLVLEDKLIRGGAFDVTCTVGGGARKIFTVPPPPPPSDK